jgi:hypothetical protein
MNFSIYCLIFTCLVSSILPVAAAPASLPSAQSPEGYIARLLINEVPFPGEHGYVSEEDSKTAMEQVLAVLANRTFNIPPQYKQVHIAGIATTNILQVITAGGIRGQVDGFYLDKNGKLAMVSRVNKRIDYLMSIANKGKPGRFARLLNYAVQISTEFVRKHKNIKDIYKNLKRIGNTSVTGCGYSWMTDTGRYHPGGNFVKIPNQDRGSLGRNRFFTLKKEHK